MDSLFYIAEIGLNHNGDIYLAKKTIEAAKKAGSLPLRPEEKPSHRNETYQRENVN